MEKITPILPAPLNHILRHLRQADQEEMEAVHGPGYDTHRLVGVLTSLANQHWGWMFWDREAGPVAVVGAYPVTPTCAGVWAFGTDAWPKVILGMTRHVKRVMVPMLLSAGFHRAECRALFKRTDTKRWLTALGSEVEAVLSEFGSRREDFLLFAWRASEQTDQASRTLRRSSISLRDGGRSSRVAGALSPFLQ